MPGLPAMRPAPNLPAERRLALVIATSTYADASLRQLRAPALDAAELATTLADPDLGGFAVTTVMDRPGQDIRVAVEDFLADRNTEDLVLVYLSCHGVMDARRRLYFAATDTIKTRLAATGVESGWLLEQLDECRARRQVVILDCCFSGAFARGAKGDSDLGLQERFSGQGRGRAVLTASRGTEYSFEGERVAGSETPIGSVFTAALIDGIRTGAADVNNDGYVSVDEAYAYAYHRLREIGANQIPQRWMYGAEGNILLSRSPAGLAIVPVPLSEGLRAGLESPHPAIRLGAVNAIGEWLIDEEAGRELTARRTLQQVAETDIPSIAQAARILLETRPEGRQSRRPPSTDTSHPAKWPVAPRAAHDEGPPIFTRQRSADESGAASPWRPASPAMPAPTELRQVPTAYQTHSLVSRTYRSPILRIIGKVVLWIVAGSLALLIAVGSPAVVDDVLGRSNTKDPIWAGFAAMTCIGIFFYLTIWVLIRKPWQSLLCLVAVAALGLTIEGIAFMAHGLVLIGLISTVVWSVVLSGCVFLLARNFLGHQAKAKSNH